MDTILWKEESDAYTKRAIQKLGISKIYDHEAEWAINFKEIILKYIKEPERILDIGCGYGAVIHEIKTLFPTSNFIGVDPGIESIKIASEGGERENAIS
jgi:tRNA G46 methylase TrmB